MGIGAGNKCRWKRRLRNIDEGVCIGPRVLLVGERMEAGDIGRGEGILMMGNSGSLCDLD